jgi:hypothetical protein
MTPDEIAIAKEKTRILFDHMQAVGRERNPELHLDLLERQRDARLAPLQNHCESVTGHKAGRIIRADGRKTTFACEFCDGPLIIQ